MDFRTFLQKNIVVFDGAFGTLLQKKAPHAGTIPEQLNIENPALIAEIHRAYVQAGADVITANTFGANEIKVGSRERSRQLIRAAIDIARKQADAAFVALDVGPIGKLLQPMGELSFEQAYSVFADVVNAGKEGADLVLIETMADLQELRAALLAARENCDLPVVCSMTFEENGRTFAGCDPVCYAMTASPLADAVGVNCSLGPEKLLPVVRTILRYTDKPVIVQANAGLPDANLCYDVSPEQFAQTYATFLKEGVRIVGGCCGTTPEYTARLRALADATKPVKRKTAPCSGVCSARKAVFFDGVRVIGERINPTGKKAMKQALLDENYGFVRNQAIEQSEAGADILDVNAGLPELDERTVLAKLVQEVQAATDLPLQIDCGKADAIEAALRVCCGKAIVNSVNGEDKTLHAILPLVKRYGAAVVGLTMDERGIPKTARQRVEIAEKIIRTCADYGIPHLRRLRHSARGYPHRLPDPHRQRRTGAGGTDSARHADHQTAIPRAYGARREQYFLRAPQPPDHQYGLSDRRTLFRTGLPYSESEYTRKQTGDRRLQGVERPGQTLRRLYEDLFRHPRGDVRRSNRSRAGNGITIVRSRAGLGNPVVRTRAGTFPRHPKGHERCGRPGGGNAGNHAAFGID